MLGDFIVALVLVEIGCFHPPQVQREPVAGEQTFSEVVPVAEPDELGICQPKLIAIGTLSPLREIVGQFVGLEVKRRKLAVIQL